MAQPDADDDNIEPLLHAAGFFRRLGDLAQEAIARHQAGTLLAEADRWEEAAGQFRAAADLFGRLGRPGHEGASRMFYASALSQLSRDEESLPEFRRAATLLESSHQDQMLVGTELGWLLALVELERWDEALERCARIERLTEDAGDALPLLHARLGAAYHRARIAALRDDLEGYLAAAQEAAPLADRLGERATARQTWLGVAGLLLGREDYAGAEAGFRRALANLDAEQAGRPLMEAECRFGIAQCLDATRAPGDDECIEQALHAARLYDGLGSAGDAGGAYYLAARHLVLKAYLDVDLRPRAAETALVAAARFEAAGNFWGKGLAQSQASFILLPEDPTQPRDPRVLGLERRAAASFERAGRYLEAASSRVAVAMEQTILGRSNWLRHGLVALRSYERARPVEFVPSARRAADRRIAQGLLLLTVNAARIGATQAATAEWRELVWRLEQATKARSFQDQGANPRAWSLLFTA